MVEDENMQVEETLNPADPVAIDFRDGYIWVRLADGRIIANPLVWYPFLQVATPAQRERVQLYSLFLLWPDFEEGISVEGLLAGRKARFTLQDYLAQHVGREQSQSIEDVPAL